MREYNANEQFAAARMARADLYFFARWMFARQRGYRWIRGPHHKAICDALMRVFRGECKRLIINVPPRYSKTELAVVNFVAWAMGQAPDAEFIHASYSAPLAVANSAHVRALVQHEVYQQIFPGCRLDSDAKSHWTTTAGGVMYAAGAGGTITGFGAGKHRVGFGGCFPVGTRVWTDRGLLPIDLIVRERMSVQAWSFDYAGRMVLRPVTGWHENPPNDIVRVRFDDGVTVECTPDHRFWTVNRGWARADSLGVDDRLPCVYGGVEGGNDVTIDAKRVGSGPDASPIFPGRPVVPVKDGGVGLCLGQDRAQVCRSPTLLDDVTTAGDGLPSIAAPNLLNDGDGNSAPSSKRFCGFSDCVIDSERLIVCQDGNGMSLGFAEVPVLLAVNDIRRPGVVTEVIKPVVKRIPVGVADVCIFGARADECEHDQFVHRNISNCTAHRKADAAIAATVVGEFEHTLRDDVWRPGACNSAPLAPDVPKVADGVGPFISGHRTPVLVEYVRHDDVTFCLTVNQYHNFTVESGLVVKNCIILDDPHKADEARSDVVRQGVIDWFQNTLESRRNSPDTPIILIMQRLHERDLAGWLLAGGNGETWEHVCLPAITAEGEALWPEKHTLDDLRRMERAAPYVFAGQYLQRPAPPEGGVIKPDAIQIIDALPAGDIRWVRGWDLAASATGDYTAGGKLGKLPDGRWVIADMVRLRCGPDERDAALVNTAARDGNAVPIGLPQDPGQAGKTQALYLTRKLSGYRVKTSPESGDKVTRAEPLAAQINVGNVLMLRGPWNQELIDEMRLFPNGTHDDQVDALSRAFSELIQERRSFFG